MRSAACVPLVLWIVVSGCEWEGTVDATKPNQQPLVQITGGAAEGEDADYRVSFQWFGSDADGLIDHFEYALDDTALWSRTTAYSATFAVPAGEVFQDGHPPTGSEVHSFYIRAVDDRGGVSTLDSRSFNARTILPSVRILRPVGVGVEKVASVSSFVGIAWSGRDEDATTSEKKPLGYQMKLVRLENSLETDDVVVRKLVHSLPPSGWSPIREINELIPDSLRVPEPQTPDDPFPELPSPEHFYETDWWPKLDRLHEAESIQLRDVPAGDYAFAVRAVDQAGAYYPNEILSRTMRLVAGTGDGDVLKLDVLPTRPVIPRLTITERNFLGTRVFTAPGQSWRVEVPANVELRFEWSADATWYGSANGNTNYGLDVPDPECEVCQSPDGIGGWIGWGRGNRFTHTFTTEDAGRQHVLYVRARDESDSSEREALALVVLEVVPFAFDKTALWVDDLKMSGIDDCEHDAIVRPILEQAIAPHLRPGERLEVFARQRIGACGEPAAPREIRLSELTRYKLVFWNVGSSGGSGTTLGDVTHNPSEVSSPTDHYLSTYVRAGGRLIVWGRFPVGALLGDFYPSAESYDPELPAFARPNFGPGTFLWDIMKLRTQFDRVGRSGITSLDPRCSGIIGLTAMPVAVQRGYPAGLPDPSGHDPSRVAIWTSQWADSGGPRFRAGNVGPEVATGVPPVRVPGLDTLYTFVPNAWSWARVDNPDYDPTDPECLTHPEFPQCQPFHDETQTACGQPFGSPFIGEPVILRYDDPATPQGRVVWIGTPLFYFTRGPGDLGDVGELMQKLTDWAFERGP